MSEPRLVIESSLRQVMMMVCHECLSGLGDYRSGAPDEGTKADDVEYCGTPGCANENLARPNRPVPHAAILTLTSRRIPVVMVNGRRYAVVEGETGISYSNLMQFARAGDAAVGLPTITYKRGPEGYEQGDMIPGESVEICDGMIFNAVDTSGA